MQTIEQIRKESYEAVVQHLTAGWEKIPGGWRRVGTERRKGDAHPVEVILPCAAKA